MAPARVAAAKGDDERAAPRGRVDVLRRGQWQDGTHETEYLFLGLGGCCPTTGRLAKACQSCTKTAQLRRRPGCGAEAEARMPSLGDASVGKLADADEKAACLFATAVSPSLIVLAG